MQGNYDEVSQISYRNGMQVCKSFNNPTIQARSAFIARQKMGRMGSPEEIASMFVYLASDEVSHIIISVLILL